VFIVSTWVSGETPFQFEHGRVNLPYRVDLNRGGQLYRDI